MSVLIDTNVLLRSVQPSHALHDSAVRAMANLIDEGDALVLRCDQLLRKVNVLIDPHHAPMGAAGADLRSSRTDH